MVTSSKEETENLTNRDIKFLIGSFTAMTTATVLALYIYNDIFKMHWSRRNSKEYYGQMNNQSKQLHQNYIWNR